MIIDDYMSFSEMLEELTNLEGSVQGKFEDQSIFMELESAEMELPVEIDISVDESGKVTIGGTPPIYYVETSFMPVFHQLKINVTSVKDLENGLK